jgi:hypothetical protein
MKVKFFLYRPWRLLGLREVEAPTFSDIHLIEVRKVVSPLVECLKMWEPQPLATLRASTACTGKTLPYFLR